MSLKNIHFIQVGNEDFLWRILSGKKNKEEINT